MLDGVRTQPGKPSSWAQSRKVIVHIRQNKTPEEKNKPESMMNVHHNVFWNWITDTKNNEQQKDFFFSDSNWRWRWKSKDLFEESTIIFTVFCLIFFPYLNRNGGSNTCKMSKISQDPSIQSTNEQVPLGLPEYLCKFELTNTISNPSLC